MKQINKTVVLSLGGSLIAPKAIDILFLKQFKRLILDFTKKGNKVIIICGGGNTAREYQKAAKSVNPQVKDRDLDWVGIGATVVNAQLLSAIFGDKAHESIMADPRIKVKTPRKIIIGAGFEPGKSSDLDALWSATAYGAKQVINLSNIAYVYDKDPRKHKDAKAQIKMSWKEFRKLVGNKWTPGANVPFDPVASQYAQKHNITVIVTKGNDLKNLSRILEGKSYIGTTIE